MLTSCRSTSFAYFSKDKNEKKCQRHLNFLKHTYLQRDQEAITALLTSLAKLSGLKLQQPLTSVSPFICILGSCYFKGHSELSVWRTCPEIFQSPLGWHPCHSRGAAGARFCTIQAPKSKDLASSPRMEARGAGGPETCTRTHTHTSTHTHVCTHIHAPIESGSLPHTNVERCHV